MYHGTSLVRVRLEKLDFIVNIILRFKNNPRRKEILFIGVYSYTNLGYFFMQKK